MFQGHVAGEAARKRKSAAATASNKSDRANGANPASQQRSNKPICYKSRRDRPDIVQFRAADWLDRRFPPRSRGGNTGSDRYRQAGSAWRERSSRSRFGKPAQPSFPKRTIGHSRDAWRAHARDPSSACTAVRDDSNVPILSSRLDRSHESAFIVFETCRAHFFFSLSLSFSVAVASFSWSLRLIITRTRALLNAYVGRFISMPLSSVCLRVAIFKTD